MKVFISYAKEDYQTAYKLFDVLKSVPVIEPWLDSENLLPGCDWKKEILDAIEGSQFVILLLSKNSINKTGFIQKEVAEALDRFSQYPPGKIYLIPARIEKCEPQHKELQEIHWVNLFLDWDDGINKIKKTLGVETIEKQVDIIRQGVHAWNQWRKDNTDVRSLLQAINLPKASLTRVNFSEANLSKADLSKADLRKANLQMADLEETNLRGANLHGANLQRARLIRTNLSQATITGAYLYGTARDDWIIDGIQCDYVYWDVAGQQRNPPDRDFRPGEFEELYKQLPTFGYVFEHGFTTLDAVVMSRIVEEINEKHPEFELKLDSFHSRGQPHAKFTVLHKEVVEEARKQITDGYESRIAALEGKQEQLMEIVSTLINKPQYIGRDYIAVSEKTQVKQLITGNSKNETTREE